MYTYAIVSAGRYYAAAHPSNPAAVIMAGSLEDVRAYMLEAAQGTHRGNDGMGVYKSLAMPFYGDAGDYADVYRVPTPSDSAKRAWLSLAECDDIMPEYRATFGPRGGVKIDRV